jgi:hypothetical protein
VTAAERLRLAEALQQGGHDAGVHPEHGVVIYYAARVWRIAGGDVRSPSLIGLAGVRVSDVQWLAARPRREPVT